MPCQNSLIMFAACAFAWAPSAGADQSDVFNLSATYSSMRDNNLFRLAPGTDPQSVGLPGKSDVVNTLGLGLNFNKLFGVQRLIANVTMIDNRYQTNDYLNFRAINYDAKWMWAFGQRWTGELMFDRVESLNSFADNRNILQRNVRTVENQRFSANYWFHTSWATTVGVFRTSLVNEQPFLAESDYDATGYNIGFRYRPVSGNTATFRVSQQEGTYSKRQFNTLAQFDNGFTQDNYDLEYDWRLTGKSQFKGRVGYLDRQHDHFSSRDYSGWVGNVDYIYTYSGKGQLTLGYKRGLESFQQATSSFYTLDEVNLVGQWAATSQIMANARAGYGWRSFEGEIVSLPAGIEQREDKISRYGFDLSYQPARWVQLKAGINFENRNSNFNFNDYKDRTGFLSATAQY